MKNIKMSGIINIDEETLKKIICESLKNKINESYQEEGLRNIFTGIGRNNGEDDFSQNKSVSYYLKQAIMFLDHGNTTMARSEIYNALRLAEYNKK